MTIANLKIEQITRKTMLHFKTTKDLSNAIWLATGVRAFSPKIHELLATFTQNEVRIVQLRRNDFAYGQISNITGHNNTEIEDIEREVIISLVKKLLDYSIPLLIIHWPSSMPLLTSPSVPEESFQPSEEQLLDAYNFVKTAY